MKPHALADEARAAMHTLEEIEDYTAFPSKDDFRLLWRLLDEKEYNLLNRAVSRISRALSSGVYRNRAINLSRGQIEGEEKEQEQEGLELHLDTTMSQTPPYFELLIVDELTPKEEAVIRSSFRSVQTARGPVYLRRHRGAELSGRGRRRIDQSEHPGLHPSVRVPFPFEAQSEAF